MVKFPVQMMYRSTKIVLVILLWCGMVGADEPRAPKPQFSSQDLNGVFFESLEESFRGQRPRLAEIRKQGTVSMVETKKSSPSATDTATTQTASPWTNLISPASLEDEIKRLRLHLDSILTTPGAFNGGGYQQARTDLSALAMLFAVIVEHGGDIRWKEQAATARDLFARTAFNCKAGSLQVFNETKLRQTDLQDLVSGSGLTARDVDPPADWSGIVNRSPIMQYAEQTLDSLKSVTNHEAKAKSNADQIGREAEIIAVIGQLLTQEGMDDYDDADYAALSRRMTASAIEVVRALEAADLGAMRTSVGAITQSCDACHEQYR